MCISPLFCMYMLAEIIPDGSCSLKVRELRIAVRDMN